MRVGVLQGLVVVALFQVSACSAPTSTSLQPDAGTAVATPPAAVTPNIARDRKLLANIEGSVDVARGTMDLIVRSPEGAVTSHSTLPYPSKPSVPRRTAELVTPADTDGGPGTSGTEIPVAIPYGTGADQFFFKTCRTIAEPQGTSRRITSSVQAVNLGAANAVTPVNAVIDSISVAGAVLASGPGAGATSGIIATYPSAPFNSADCSTTTTWTFMVPAATRTTFTFQAHAEGFLNPANCPNPSTCADQKIECGETGDGCGGILECGTCTAPQTCGGGGVASVCGAPNCTPQTCQQANANCGMQANGCGGLMDCGTCDAPQTCGGSGVYNKCGAPTKCTPATCADLPVNCGVQADGCGGATPSCGTCTAPLTCGGGGVQSVCGRRCGGVGNVACPSGCDPGLSVIDGLCNSYATTVLNMASINVTGPAAVEGVPLSGFTWCETERSDPDPIVGPCPPSLANAPAWAPGQAFTVVDETAASAGASPPRIYVPSPYLTLTTDLSFTDDTSKVKIVLDPGTSVESTFTWFPEALEGDHAEYQVTLQRWIDGATNCGSLASSDPDFPGVDYSVPSPDGSKGCWTYLNENGTVLETAGPDTTTTFTLPMYVRLPAVSNYLRYVVNVAEGDYRNLSSSSSSPFLSQGSPLQGVSGWTQTGPIDAEYFPSQQLELNLWMYHPWPSSALSYVKALSPFQLVVQPFAMAQLKVLPYTLVYTPPGDASKATFATTTSYGLNYTYDNKLTANTSSTVDDKLSNTASASFNGSNLASAVAGSSFGIGETASGATSWDNSTQLGTGMITDVAVAQNASYAVTYTFTAADPGSVPGAKGTFAKEPFWADSFVLLIHPQIAVWQISGQPVVSLLGASGGIGSPSFARLTIGDLDSCYRRTGIYAAGLPVPGTKDVLTSTECQQLLQLDPLYGVGQSYPSVASNPRFVLATQGNYGVDPVTLIDVPSAISATTTSTVTTTVQNVGSYTATITDVLSSTDSLSASASAFGLGFSETIGEGETTTKASNWTVTLTSSVAATAQSSTTLTGSFDDNHGATSASTPLGYYPFIQVYRDTMFGSFLFVDPTAPAGP